MLELSISWWKICILFRLFLTISEFQVHLIFEGKESSFLSKPEQLIPPVIAGMNSVLTTSTSCLSSLPMFGIVRMKYVGLKPVMKHE